NLCDQSRIAVDVERQSAVSSDDESERKSSVPFMRGADLLQVLPNQRSVHAFLRTISAADTARQPAPAVQADQSALRKHRLGAFQLAIDELLQQERSDQPATAFDLGDSPLHREAVAHLPDATTCRPEGRLDHDREPSPLAQPSDRRNDTGFRLWQGELRQQEREGGLVKGAPVAVERWQ